MKKFLFIWPLVVFVLVFFLPLIPNFPKFQESPAIVFWIFGMFYLIIFVVVYYIVLGFILFTIRKIKERRAETINKIV